MHQIMIVYVSGANGKGRAAISHCAWLDHFAINFSLQRGGDCLLDPESPENIARKKTAATLSSLSSNIDRTILVAHSAGASYCLEAITEMRPRGALLLAPDLTTTERKLWATLKIPTRVLVGKSDEIVPPAEWSTADLIDDDHPLISAQSKCWVESQLTRLIEAR